MVEAVNTASQKTNHSSFAVNEVQAAQDVLFSFVKAVKNYGLFPESHSTSKKFLTAIKGLLDVFLKEFGFLRFDIKKDTFLYNGSPISKGKQETEDLALQLYRDGVQWIELEKGIELKEISLFLKIINKYKNISQEDAEDDLVTALWSADLFHVHYEATDIFWDGEPLLDFAGLNKIDHGSDAEKMSKGSGREKDFSSSAKGKKNTSPGEKTQDKAQSHQSPVQIQDVDPGLYSISVEEEAILKHIVEKEEAKDGKHDALDVLLIILLGENDKHNFLMDLDFFKEEFRNVLSVRDFEFALELLKKMYVFFHESKSEKPWARPLLEDFFKEISSPKILNVLLPVLSVLGELDKTQVKLLAKFLVSLHPQAIKSLGLMVPQIVSNRIQRLLLDIISYMANRDIGPLVALLDHPDEKFVLQLVHVLGRINNLRSSTLLIDKMVHHTSDKVRRESLKILIARDTQEVTKLFHLVSDSNNSVRVQLLRYLGKTKSKNAEDLLRNYIKDLQRNHEEEHILNCYKALGRCGSNRSLPFLRGVLLSRPWNWFYGFGTYQHRRGAALALASLETEESTGALLNASNSMFPHVRAAYRNAIGE